MGLVVPRRAEFYRQMLIHSVYLAYLVSHFTPLRYVYICASMPMTHTYPFHLHGGVSV